MIANHYVIDEILAKLVDKDAKKTFEKFVGRYQNDTELKEVYALYIKALEKKESIEKVKQRLAELSNVRKLESSGGTSLPFKDRRHFK